MDADTFKAWQAHMQLSNAEAARQLGKSEDTISRYRRLGVPASESTLVSKTCTAVALNLPGWTQK